MAGQPFEWPGAKRVAVYINAQLEVWSPGKAPTYSVQTTGVKKGQIDYGGISWSQYGGKVGVWRVMKVLDQFDMKGTFAANAMCAELFPEALAEIVRSGHDIAGHGIWQDESLPEMTPDEQRLNIRKSLDMIEKATGKRPEGWKSTTTAWTPESIEFLAQEGLLWFSDMKDTDLPRRIRTKHGAIIALPPSEFTDNRTLRGNPRDYYDVYKDTFDYLYKSEPGSLLNLAVHCHSGGRPMIMAVLCQLLEYFSRFPDIWFTTHGDIARWMQRFDSDEVTYAKRFFNRD
jgi:allantoinase